MIERLQICESCGKEFKAKKNGIRFCTKGCNKKCDKSYAWKGDDVSIKVLHKWVERRLIRPKCCSKCGKEGKVDLANISNEYKRELSDWEWLCRKCHMKEDGRLEKFLYHSKDKKLPTKNCENCNREFAPRLKVSKYCSKSCSATTNNLKRDYSYLKGNSFNKKNKVLYPHIDPAEHQFIPDVLLKEIK